MFRTRKPILYFLALIALLAITSLACQVFTPSQQQNTPVVEKVVVQTQAAANQAPAQAMPTIDLSNVAPGDEALVQLYARVNPSVVNITNYAKDQSGNVLPASQGSGFIYDAAGYIVSNAHVVQGADQIEVTFSDGLIREATLVGIDLNSDLAVVKVDNMPEGLAALPLGSMDKLAVGQSVIAIGNPFGMEGTMTRGVISALGRTIPALNIFSIPQSIQTDAAINPGNSGGPLLDLNGEVIGINAQIESTSSSGGQAANSGVGFAIPVSIIQLVVPSLIENGDYTWPYIGVRGSGLTYELIKGMNLPVEKGAYIWEVTSGGPAEQAGLRGADKTIDVDGRQADVGGDVVIAVDGQPIASFDDLLIYVALHTRPGDTVTFTIIRDGKQMDVPITLQPRPTS